MSKQLDEILVVFGTASLVHAEREGWDGLVAEAEQKILQWVNDEVIGESTDIERIKIGRYKNIKGERQGADIESFNKAENVAYWQNMKLGQQRAVLKEHGWKEQS